MTSNNLNQQQIIRDNNFSLMSQQATASTSTEFNSEKHSFDFHVPQQYVIFEERVLSWRLGMGSTEGTPSRTSSVCSKIAASLGRQIAEIAARPINRDLPVPDFNSAQDSGSINASCPPAMSNPGLINDDDSINSLSIEGSNSLAASSVWYGGKKIFHQFKKRSTYSKANGCIHYIKYLINFITVIIGTNNIYCNRDFDF